MTIQSDYPFSNSLNNGIRLAKDYLGIESINGLSEGDIFKLTTIPYQEFENFLKTRESNVYNCGVNQDVFDFVVARECLTTQEMKSGEQIAKKFFDLLLYSDLLRTVVFNVKPDNKEKCLSALKSLSLSAFENRFELSDINNLQFVDINELYYHVGDNIGVIANVVNYYSEKADDVIPVLFSNYLKTMSEQSRDIVKRRETDTLQEIGDTYGVTREYIRQIEAKEKSRFQDFYSKNLCSDSEDLIFVFPTVSKVFPLNTYKQSLGEDNNLFRNLFASLTYVSGAKYYKVFDAIIESENVYSFGARIADEVFGEYLKKAEVNEKIAVCLESLLPYGFNEEVMMVYIKNCYKDKGATYVRIGSGFSKVNQVNIILEKYFDDGFHYSDEKDIEELNNKAIEEFGAIIFDKDDIASRDKHTVQGVIERADVHLVGRGTYVHESKAPILGQEMTDKIIDYINNKNCAVAYSDLFETFKDELSTYGVTNKYALQGALSPHHGGLFTGKRDYATPVDNQLTLKQIILNWMNNQSGLFTYEEFEKEFKGVAQSVFMSCIYEHGRMAYYWQRGYINIDKLNITDEEKTKLKQLLKFLINQYRMEYCSADEMYDLLNIQMSDFLIDKKIRYSYDLFSIMQIIFAKEFKFQRPLIGNENAVFESTDEIIDGYLETKKTVNLFNMRKFVEGKVKARNTDAFSIARMIKTKWNEFVAIDVNTIVRKETITLTDKELIRLDVVIDVLFEGRDSLDIQEDIVSKHLFKEIAGMQVNKFLIFGLINTYLHDKYDVVIESGVYRFSSFTVLRKNAD